MSQARSLRCPVCSHVITFVVSVDRATKKPRVSIVVPPDAIKTDAGESLGASSRGGVTNPDPPPPQPPSPRPKGPAKGVFGTCLCGEEFQVDDEELTSIQACPRCGVKYHVVVKSDRATKVRSAILVPMEGAKPVKPRMSNSVLMRPPRATKRTVAPARTKGPAPKPVTKPPPAIPPGAQAVRCSCGEVLVVRRKDVEAGLTCGTCGKSMRLMEDRDPQTLAPRIRIRPEPKK